eukprot:11204_1
MADRNYYRRGRRRGRGGGYRGSRGYRGGRSRGGGRASYHSVSHTRDGLRSLLSSLDGQGYGAYKQLKSTSWDFDHTFTLYFDRIQADPFAPASNLRVRVFNQVAHIPSSLFNNKIRNIATCDYLTRQFANICRKYDYDRRATGPWSAKKGGDLLINNPKQHVIERTSCFINTEFIEVRFDCALPGRGRTIEGRWCADVLCKNLPFVIERSMMFNNLNKKEFETHVNCVEDQEYLREIVLPKLGLIAFIANDSILPRQSGISDKPMPTKDGAIPFIYNKLNDKDTLFVDNIKLKNNTNVTLCGVGIPKGITLIVGGGFHGKSTLLNALEYGVYNNIPGDGREYVSCCSNALKIRSEDRRFINNVCITPFIKNLPQNKSCSHFNTENASGSTSMAANIIEGLEMGTNLVLIDEDTSATNFMIRDYKMDKLVTSKVINEPITPFISKIRALYNDKDVSSILVIGGVGQYFQVADHVILMNNYKPQNITMKAKALITDHITEYKTFGNISERYLKWNSFRSPVGVKMKTDKGQKICFGDDIIDLQYISQIVEKGQLQAIAKAVRFIKQNVLNSNKRKAQWGVAEILAKVKKDLDNDYIRSKLDVLHEVNDARYAYTKSNKLVRPRLIEIGCALNRLRALSIYSEINEVEYKEDITQDIELEGDETSNYKMNEVEYKEDITQDIELEGDETSNYKMN